jgi:hypothetical protein
VFVLLAGTAAYLHGQRLGSTRALSRYLFREHSRAPRASDDRRQRRPALGAKPARRSGVALCLRRVVDVGARPRSATRGSPGQHWPPRSPIRAGAPLDHVNDLGWTALIESIVLGAVNSGARARCKGTCVLTCRERPPSVSTRGSPNSMPPLRVSRRAVDEGGRVC